MTDFVIVVASIAALSAPSPVPGTPGIPPERQLAPGSYIYRSLQACEEEIVRRRTLSGQRLFCLPVEALPSAY